MVSSQADKPKGKISAHFVGIRLPAEFPDWQGKAAFDIETGEIYLPVLWMDKSHEFIKEAVDSGEILFKSQGLAYANIASIMQRTDDESRAFISELAVVFGERMLALRNEIGGCE